jgi:hypothetical protein
MQLKTHPLNLTVGEIVEAVREANQGAITVTFGGEHEGAAVIVLDGEHAPRVAELVNLLHDASDEAIAAAKALLEADIAQQDADEAVRLEIERDPGDRP